MTRYHVCTRCGYTEVRDGAPEACLSCDAPPEDLREYATLAEADAEVGHLFKRPSLEARGPTASELTARARSSHV